MVSISPLSSDLSIWRLTQDHTHQPCHSHNTKTKAKINNNKNFNQMSSPINKMTTTLRQLLFKLLVPDHTKLSLPP